MYLVVTVRFKHPAKAHLTATVVDRDYDCDSFKLRFKVGEEWFEGWYFRNEFELIDVF